MSFHRRVDRRSGSSPLRSTTKTIIALFGLLLLALPAYAQYTTIPNEPSGTGCPSDQTQCSGYKVLGDINNRFNGSLEIDPDLGTGTTLWGLALGTVPGVGFCLGHVGSTWGPLACATSATAPIALNSGVISLGNISPATSTTVSGATTLVLPASPLDSIQTLTFIASATVTIPQGSFAGQSVGVFVCQNPIGGNTPSFVPIAGLTITGTFPTFTTTANACGDFALVYTTTTSAFLSGKNGGPL